jgi:hypothetical protein
MMAVELKSDRYIRDLVAHLRGVTDAVYDNAKTIKKEAESRLAMHRYYKDDNAAEVTMTRGDVDTFVNLEDAKGGAIAIEFGHRTAKGTHVPGKHIITGAAGLA